MKICCPKFCTLLKVGAGLGGEEGAGAGDCAQPKPDRPSAQTTVKIKDALAAVSADKACEAVTGLNVEWGLEGGKFMGDTFDQK